MLLLSANTCAVVDIPFSSASAISEPGENSEFCDLLSDVPILVGRDGVGEVNDGKTGFVVDRNDVGLSSSDEENGPGDAGFNCSPKGTSSSFATGIFSSESLLEGIGV